jgi:hypothetical protein
MEPWPQGYSKNSKKLKNKKLKNNNNFKKMLGNGSVGFKNNKI